MNPKREDFHSHTVFSDGKDTPEEMILEALQKKMTALGFSEHSPVPFDPEGGMPDGTQEDYIREVTRLKEKYRGSIRILCGLEQDFYSPDYREKYDHIIGSVHYLKVGNDVPFAIDNTPDILKENVLRYFSGDYIRAAEWYYDTVSHVVEKTDCTLIGHYDLITKYNEKYRLFDITDERYRKAWKKAADRLLLTGVPFEINTGGMFRGWKSVTYPHPEILAYLKRNGASFVLSGDAHCRKALMYRFDEAFQMLDKL